MTLPKEVRAKLGLKPGDRLQVTATPDGRVLLTPTVPLASLAGILPAPDHPLTVEEMNEAIAGAVTEKRDRR
jgi:AbrB family looped-hinge helix DNA binding protein